jgi:hypothetical protein
MNPVASNTATRYLERLRLALADAPAELRDDIVSGISEELVGLDDAAAGARIAELGDPAAIASEALAGVPARPAKRSSAYLAITVALLVVGGYIFPGIGWIAALILVGIGSAWTPGEKKRAIWASVAAAVVALALIFLLRGEETGILALILFFVVPFVTNVVVGIWLSLKWRASAGA